MEMCERRRVLDIDWLRDNVGARRWSLRALFAGYGEQVALGETRLADMPFNMRCQNCLRQAGLMTLGALNDVSVEILLERPAFGWGTLEHMLTVYMQSFQMTFASSGDLLFEEPILPGHWDGDADSTFLILADAQRLRSSALERTLASLSLTKRASRALKRLGVVTVGDLLMRRPCDLIQGVTDGISIAQEIRERLSQAADQWVLADTLRELLTDRPLHCEVLEAAATKLDVPADEVRTRLLMVPGVLIMADQAHWVEGSETILLPRWEFNSYRDLLTALLQQSLSPRQAEVVSDYYGLFAEPLSRRELAEKHGGVVPQRIYQILKKSGECLMSQPSLLSLFWLPIRQLLRQHRGIVSRTQLEGGIVTQFGCCPGEVRGTGLLAMLEDHTVDTDGFTVVDDRLVLATPVTFGILEALIGIIYEKLMAAPRGLPEDDVQRTFAEHWGEVMPGHPTPDVAVADLAWMHPKIIVEGRLWSLRRRRPRRRLTDRLTRLGRIEAVLSEHSQPMLVQDLFDECRERYGEINVPASRTALKKNEHVFRAYERGIYGLVGWRDYSPSELQDIRLQSRRSTPRTILDKVEAVLEESGLPMHIQDLLRALQDRFEEGEERGVRTALLVRPERFQAHRNGIYGLTAWGEDAATVLEEAAIDFLEQRGYPASETEICDGLRGQFPISVSVCRWALRQAWERAGSIVPLEGGLWDLADEETSGTDQVGISVDDLLLEQLLSC